MQMLVDAALITKKSAALDYNTDSVNAAGKIWPREIVHSDSGIKAAGKSQGKPYYVLASADAKGTAESAADLFKNCVSSFLPDGSNYSEAIADFFRVFAQVLDKSGYDSSSCDLAIFAGYNDRVYLAKNGKARLFRYSEDDFFEAKPQLFPHEDAAASYGVSVYSETKPGDIFILLSGKVGAYVSEALIKAIVRNSNGDVKRIVALIASNAVKNGCDDAVSVIALKVVADETAEDNEFVPPVPVVENKEDADGDPDEAQTETSNDYYASQRNYIPTEEDVDEETESVENINRYKSRNKFSRIAIFDIIIVVVAIAVLLGVLAVKGVFGPKRGQTTKDGVNVSDLFDETETSTKKNEKESTTAEKPDQSSVSSSANASNTFTQRAAQNTTASNNNATPNTTRRPYVYTRPTTPYSTTPTTAQPPVTTPPQTETPATTPPETEPPVSTPPETEPPVTNPPATEPPVTEPPVTRDPNIADDD